MHDDRRRGGGTSNQVVSSAFNPRPHLVETKAGPAKGGHSPLSILHLAAQTLASPDADGAGMRMGGRWVEVETAQGGMQENPFCFSLKI